jgi:hypothetical protein
VSAVLAMTQPAVQLMPARFVTIPVAATITGLTQKAIERKIEKGEWAEGLQYRRRDGRIFIDIKGYEKWIEAA